jgi:mannitol-1-/sugar-/sorbitol-6-phosphatase
VAPSPRLQCKALLFDMDGVLVDSTAIVERTWRRWAARHGIKAEPLLQVAHGRRTRETLQAVVPRLAVPEEIAWLETAELADDEGLQSVAGAERLLAMLTEVPWAVVTSAGSELARRRLARAGLPMPRVLVTSEDVTSGKPAPDGYLLSAQRLGVAPRQAVVFEDTPPGIAAARSAGSAVIGVATTHAPAQLMDAAFVVADLTTIGIEPDGDCWYIRASATGLGAGASSPHAADGPHGR